MSQNHNNPVEALFSLLGNFADYGDDSAKSPETLRAESITRDFLNQVAPEEALFTLELPGMDFLAGDWHGNAPVHGTFEDFMGQFATEKALAESLYLNRPFDGLNFAATAHPDFTTLVGGILSNVDDLLANLDRENARLEAEREACKRRHPAGKGASTTSVHVGDAKVSMTTDERGTKRVQVEDPTVTWCKYDERSGSMTAPDAATVSEFMESVIANIFENKVVHPAAKMSFDAIMLPHVGEVLTEDNSLLDFAENCGLMIEDRNKGIFMFDENTCDPEGNLSYAWFAWGDTKPSYPAFPAKVIRVP